MYKQDVTINISQFSQNAPHYKRFLKRLPSNSDIQFISMAFYDIARAYKELTPAQLLDLSISKLSSKHPHTIQYLDSYKLEALDFATYVLDKVNLLKEAQRIIKQKEKEKYRNEYMATKEPTPAQISLLKYLGFEGAIRNRFEASELISKLKEKENEPGNKDTGN